MADHLAKQQAIRDANEDALSSWPLNHLPDGPAYFRAMPTRGYGLGEGGNTIITGCALYPLQPHTKTHETFNHMLSEFGPEVRIVMPTEGIVAGEKYQLVVTFAGNDDDDETVDSYEFQFLKRDRR